MSQVSTEALSVPTYEMLGVSILVQPVPSTSKHSRPHPGAAQSPLCGLRVFCLLCESVFAGRSEVDRNSSNARSVNLDLQSRIQGQRKHRVVSGT